MRIFCFFADIESIRVQSPCHSVSPLRSIKFQVVLCATPNASYTVQVSALVAGLELIPQFIYTVSLISTDLVGKKVVDIRAKNKCTARMLL